MNSDEFSTEIRSAISALSDANREKIVFLLLKEGDLSYSQLRNQLDIPKGGLTSHLEKLVLAGLIRNQSIEKPQGAFDSCYEVTDFAKGLVVSIVNGSSRQSSPEVQGRANTKTVNRAETNRTSDLVTEALGEASLAQGERENSKAQGFTSKASGQKPDLSRRSETEILVDVLKAVSEGYGKPTQIGFKAGLSWVALTRRLGQLTQKDLVETRDAGSRRTYVITKKGSELLESYRKIRREIRERDEETQDPIQRSESSSALSEPGSSPSEKLRSNKQSL